MNEKQQEPPPVAVITGGSSGIGLACAQELASDGFDIGITYRSGKEAAERVVSDVSSTGRRCEARLLDLADPPGAHQVIDELARALGGISVLVNNAGVNRREAFLTETLADWQRVLNINLTGPWRCSQAAVPYMLAGGGGGRIINVTSVLARVPLQRGAAYCASKGGLELLSQVMALELAPHGITVNSVAPGHIVTPMTGAQEPKDGLPTRQSSIPLGRPGDVQEIARVIAFLCSSDASYATGSSFLVDGGLLLVSGPKLLEESN